MSVPAEPLVCGACRSRLERRQTDEPHLIACACGASRIRLLPEDDWTLPTEPRWWPALRAALERTGGTVRTSCELAGVTRQAVYAAAGHDPTFRAVFRVTVRECRARSVTLRRTG